MTRAPAAAARSSKNAALPKNLGTPVWKIIESGFERPNPRGHLDEFARRLRANAVREEKETFSFILGWDGFDPKLRGRLIAVSYLNEGQLSAVTGIKGVCRPSAYSGHRRT
jgi:hypothetical protein